MSSLENGRILFDGDASTLAFRAGQVVERLLLQRGLERARSSESPIVTADTIEACINEFSLDDLRSSQEGRELAPLPAAPKVPRKHRWT